MSVADPLGIAGTVVPLALARALPLSLLAPLTGRFVPQTVSLSLVVALACAGLDAAQPIDLAGGAWMAAVLRELCLGLTFAFACSVPLYAAVSTGRLVDGWGRANARAPAASYGALYELTALFSFFALGGHRAWFASYARTLIDAPLGELSFARTRFLDGVLTLSVDAIALSLTLALPLLVSLWFCELAIGLLQRAAGGSAFSFFELLRTVAVAGLVLLTAPLLIEALPQAMRTALAGARALIASIFS